MEGTESAHKFAMRMRERDSCACPAPFISNLIIIIVTIICRRVRLTPSSRSLFVSNVKLSELKRHRRKSPVFPPTHTHTCRAHAKGAQNNGSIASNVSHRRLRCFSLFSAPSLPPSAHTQRCRNRLLNFPPSKCSRHTEPPPLTDT